MAKKEIGYDEAMRRVEAIIAKFQNKEMSVDTLAEEVKTATELLALCRAKLDRQEQELRGVLRGEEESQ